MKKARDVLANPSILTIRPYQPGKPISEVQRELGLTDVVKLASNENPLGPSPLAVEAMQSLLAELHFYPETGEELKGALAERNGVTPDYIALGHGGTDLLGVIVRTFVMPGDELVIAHPTFPWFAMLGQQVGAKNVMVPLRDGVHDLDAMAASITARTKIVFLANPNNPTGTVVPPAKLDAFVAALPEHVVLVLDEAYVDYMDAELAPSWKSYVHQKPVIVARTFSKIAGLAGIRIAYAIAEPELISLLDRVQAPFSTTNLAQVAALSSLRDEAHRQASRELARSGRQMLRAELERLGLPTAPSQANFVFVDFHSPIEPISQALLQRGFVIRPMLETCARITVGTVAQNAAFVRALEQVLSEGGFKVGMVPTPPVSRSGSQALGR